MTIVEIIKNGDEKSFENMIYDLIDSPAMNYILDDYVLEHCCIDEENVDDRCKYFRTGYGCVFRGAYDYSYSKLKEKCKHLQDNRQAAYNILYDWFTKEIKA